MVDLSGFVQQYDWGGKHFIPNFIGTKNEGGVPFAELWFGIHPKGPATVKGLDEELLAFLNKNPELLGRQVRTSFDGKLPFLLKILDVSDMLSIQAHPNRKEAEIGFAAEEAAGIPISASNRVFRDPNPKPEMMLALTDFWLLHGFKTIERIRKTLQSVQELAALLPLANNIQNLYTNWMQLPQEEVNVLLQPLQERLLSVTFPDKQRPEYWAKKALQTFRRANGDIDRGVLSIFIMNIVHLKPGEAIFQGSGILHAYLEGVNVELMANSDNVFRGGLTSKHIDVPALLGHIGYQSIIPDIRRGKAINAFETVFSSEFPEFELAMLKLTDTLGSWNHKNEESLEIYLVLEGSVSANGQLKSEGAAFLLGAGEELLLRCEDSGGKAVLVRAYVPMKESKTP